MSTGTTVKEEIVGREVVVGPKIKDFEGSLCQR